MKSYITTKKKLTMLSISVGRSQKNYIFEN